MDSFYKIVGDITIPEEKKAELNDCVLKVLDRCGLRKIKKTKIGNSQIEVSCRVKPDTKGKVTFDYSIFEKKHRKPSYYNTNTCELFTNECGFSEFGLAMMMVLTLIESYSITPCYMVRAGEITNVASCAEVIEDLIGVRLRFPHRADIWETYLFCRDNRDQITMKPGTLWKIVPVGYEKTDIDMLIDVIEMEDDSLLAENLKMVSFNKGQIGKAVHNDRIKYLYSAFMTPADDRKSVEDWLKRVIPLTLAERNELSEGTSGISIIAELSKYMTAATMLHVYALTFNKDFWKVWEQLTVDGYYKEIIREDEDDEASEQNYGPGLKLYKAMFREDEDEFLGEFSKRELCLSSAIEGEIENWKKCSENDIIPENKRVDMLAEILSELQTDWKVRIPDMNLVKELSKPDNSDNARKILGLIKSVLNDGIELFPELTTDQARKWILGWRRSKYESKRLDALMGLLANKNRRFEILGY